MEWPVASVATTHIDGNTDFAHDLFFDNYADPTLYVLALREQGLLSPPHYAPIAIQLPSIIPNPLPVVYT